MRTNLSMVLKTLTTGILDPYIFQTDEYSNVNQITFLTRVFPLYFLNSPDNQQILQVGKSNSSRLSNLFTRQSDPKRRESKFRERFLKAFDDYFIDEMLICCRFILRNYQKEAFEKWIEELLLEDGDLRSDENMFFYRYITSNYKNNPSIALMLILVWAFHIDDFKPLIQILEQHPVITSGHLSTGNTEVDALEPLKKLLQEYELDPNDVRDFVDIAYKYGICSYLGAIAIKTYVDTHTNNNPLITAELADMYFYGNNFRKSMPEKAMNLYTINANNHYGSALWSIGQISSNEKFDINQTPVNMSMHYYERAIQRNHALSYNNVGKWWIYSLHFHLFKVVGIPEYRNIFANQGRQAVSDIYNIMIQKSDFTTFLETHGLSGGIPFNDLSPSEMEQLFEQIENAENFIVEAYIMQSYYKQKYFFALGTCALIYDYQYARRQIFIEKYNLPSEADKQNNIWKKYTYFVTEYSKFQISASQYMYANYLKRTQSDDQDIYEYLYRAAFEMPGNDINNEAMLDFLSYHVNPKVVYKKNQIDFDSSLIEAVIDYVPNYQTKSHHVYQAVQLMLAHLKGHTLNKDTHDLIMNRLAAEALAHPTESSLYDSLSELFKNKFYILS